MSVFSGYDPGPPDSTRCRGTPARVYPSHFAFSVPSTAACAILLSMAYALGLPLPQNWQDFESLCKDLWRLIWDDPLAQKHGRSGDPQAGVDICGRRGEKWEGVQCKQKEWHKRLGAAQIRREADKAGGFEPALARFILATTVPRDPKTQADVRAINDAGEYPFEMAVFAWDDVLEELQAFPQLIRKFYPEWSRQALCGVPSTRSVQFVGREAELEQLRQLVRRAGSVRIAASVEGLAGIGKTELALQLVHRLAAEGDFPGGIFWFDAEDPDLAPIWGSVIADDLGIAEGPLAERAALAVRSLSRHDAATLVVLDNVEEWTGSRQPAPLPKGAHLRYLVTTRRRRLGGARFQHVDLGFLEPEYARRLLAAVAGRDPAAAPRYEELLEHLGGHALAVELAGAWNLGEDHPDVAIRRSNLAVVLDEQGDLAGARELLELALESGLKNLGEDHPEVATRRNNLAVVLRAQGDLVGARQLHELVVQSLRKNLGEDHPHVATSRSNLAAVLKDQGHLPAARELLKLALESNLKNLGEDHPQVAMNRSILARVLKDRGNLAGARELLELALASDLKNLGEDHPQVAKSRSTLALVLKAQGDLPGARELLELALASDLKNLGEGHRHVATRRFHLAGICESEGDLDGARELFERALEDRKNSLGKNHSHTALTRVRLADVLRQLGDTERARVEAQVAMDVVAGQPEGSPVRVQVEENAGKVLAS